MKKRIFLITVCGVMILCLLAACGKGNQISVSDIPNETQDSDVISNAPSEESDPTKKVEKETISETTTSSAERTGTGNYQGLTFEATCKNAKAVSVKVKNDSSDGYSLGWVQGPTVTCKTTNGEYYYSLQSARISAGASTSFNCYFDEAEGDIISLSISGVNTLSGQGMPMDFSGGANVEIFFN